VGTLAINGREQRRRDSRGSTSETVERGKNANLAQHVVLF
jgi:hypothetical protein